MKKVVLITGATRGIGKATALRAARRGFAVAVTGRTRREGDGHLFKHPSPDPIGLPGSIETTVREITEAGGEALGIELDIGDRQAIDHVVDTVLARWGRIDGLFNNATYQSPYAMLPMSVINADILETAMRCMMVNQFHITQRVLEPMLAQGGGRIVFISSGAAKRLCDLRLGEGGWDMVVAAGKAAYSKLAEFVDLEYRDRGIASFHVEPGLTIHESMNAQFGDVAKGFGGGLTAYASDDTARTVAWMLDAPEALAFTGPQMHSAPTFFADHGISDTPADAVAG